MPNPSFFEQKCWYCDAVYSDWGWYCPNCGKMEMGKKMRLLSYIAALVVCVIAFFIKSIMHG